ncbi:MAG: DUF2065 domain-containing protein [Magnetococcales bacterium]|nr:DUF2065 domain-containing protein [Magnetococcales bacterium]
MNDFLTAIGLVMILEGIPYFAVPEQMRRMVIHVAELPDGFLRKTGLVLMCAGLLLVYWVRG